MFTFLTYNILSTKYALTSKHDSCPKFYRLWDHRWKRIQAQLKIYKPDIFTLHEVDLKVLNEQIQPFVNEMKYTTVQYTRTGRSSLGLSRVTCIFSKEALFEVEGCEVILMDRESKKYFHDYR
eukprot:UN34167